MSAPSRNGDYAGEAIDLDRREPVGLRVVAELAGQVPAPGPDGGVAREGQRMELPSGHGDDPGKVLHLDRRMRVRGRVIAELPVLVPAPGARGGGGAGRRGAGQAAKGRQRE